jgi:hypothetical protein
MGEAVNVGVMVEVGEAVTVAVGEGVSVIVAVGRGLANTPVPHPTNKMESPKTRIIVFFIQFLYSIIQNHAHSEVVPRMSRGDR